MQEGDDVLPGPEDASPSAAAAEMEEQFRRDEVDMARENQASPVPTKRRLALDTPSSSGATPAPTTFPWPSPAGWTPSSGSRAVPPHLETPSSNKRVKSESSTEQLHNTACDGNKSEQIFVPDYTVALESLDTWENMIPSKYHNYYLNRKFQGKPDTADIDENLFTLEAGYAQWSDSAQCFFINIRNQTPSLKLR